MCLLSESDPECCCSWSEILRLWLRWLPSLLTSLSRSLSHRPVSHAMLPCLCPHSSAQWVITALSTCALLLLNTISKKLSPRIGIKEHCLNNPCAFILVGYFVCHCHKTVFLFTASCWDQWSLWQGWAGIKSWNGMCVVTDSDPPPPLESSCTDRGGARGWHSVSHLRPLAPTTDTGHGGPGPERRVFSSAGASQSTATVFLLDWPLF